MFKNIMLLKENTEDKTIDKISSSIIKDFPFHWFVKLLRPQRMYRLTHSSLHMIQEHVQIGTQIKYTNLRDNLVQAF
ncbi:hypothetical protein CDL12_21667 [Handroanthus impetiginosus]|uniref:Uncharacterized protein n=1 Tax=Handroanthus impetiginosus TaxID=429701 RepID=A0A2G9GKL1_9LAMI|nr:hypothetical protein CDL12_21667 [Handroanthus impetiginosus]